MKDKFFIKIFQLTFFFFLFKLQCFASKKTQFKVLKILFLLQYTDQTQMFKGIVYSNSIKDWGNNYFKSVIIPHHLKYPAMQHDTELPPLVQQKRELCQKSHEKMGYKDCSHVQPRGNKKRSADRHHDQRFLEPVTSSLDPFPNLLKK